MSSAIETIDESARRRFEQAWQQGAPGELASYLPAPDDPRYLATLEELVHIELEFAWKTQSGADTAVGASSSPPKVEDYLARFPALNRPDVLMRLLRQEYRVRHRHGDRPTADEYPRRYPELVKDGSQIETRLESKKPADLLPDVPGYRILQVLGRGGMGVVYKARQEGLKRDVALKLIRGGEMAGPDDLSRFQTEAEAAAELQHPHIVQVYEIGATPSGPFVSLEFVAGGSLHDFVRGTPQSARLAARVVQMLAQAMEHAHRHGIIHRDLKPANVLLAPRVDQPGGDSDSADTIKLREDDVPWVPKIADFGLAKRLATDSGQTQTGAILGTPSYMAPEQAAARKDIGPAADVYALGAILYEMLTGRPPFRAATGYDTILQVINEDPVPPRRLAGKVPVELETICLKCLAKPVHRRYASAQELVDELGRFLNGEPIRARPVGVVERGVKWVRRRPALAGLLLASWIAAVALIAFGVSLFYADELRDAADYAESQRLLAESQRGEAVTQRAIADQQRAEAVRLKLIADDAKELAEQQRKLARRMQYFAQVGRAERAWDDGDGGRMSDLLAGVAPAPGEDDLRGFEWHFLMRRSRNLLTLPGHAEPTFRLAFNRDGTLLASLGLDRVVKIWDVPTGKLLHTLRDAKTWLYGDIAFSPMNNTLATTGKDGTLRLYDASTGKPLGAWPGPANAVTRMIFTPDGNAVVADEEGAAVFRKIPGGNVLRKIPLKLDRLRALGFDAERRLITLGSSGKDLVVRLPETDVPAVTLKGLVGDLSTATLSPDGTRVAAASDSLLLRVWDARDGKLIFGRKGLPKRVTSLGFSPDGKWLASGSDDLVVRVRNAATGDIALTLRGHGPSPRKSHFSLSGIPALVFAPDSRRLASAGEDNTLRLWEANSGADAVALEGFDPARETLRSFDRLGRRILGGERDGSQLKIWDVNTGKELARFRDPGSGGILSWDLTPDRRFVCVRRLPMALERVVQVIAVDTGNLVATLANGYQQVNEFALDAAGKRLVLGDHALDSWSLVTYQRDGEFAGHEFRVSQVAFRPNGAQLASVSEDQKVTLWNAATGKRIRDLLGHRNWVRCVAWSADGSRLVSAGDDSSVRVWDPDTGKQTLLLKGHPDAVLHVAFSPDGERIVSWGDQGTLKLWDAHTGQEALTLKGNSIPFFAADSRRLLYVHNNQLLFHDGRP